MMNHLKTFELELKFTEKSLTLRSQCYVASKNTQPAFFLVQLGQTTSHNRQKTCTGQFILTHWTTPFKLQFEQTDWIVFKKIQEFFLRSLRGKDFAELLGQVLQLCKDDFKGDELKTQLETLRYFPESTIDNAKKLVEFVQSLSATTKTCPKSLCWQKLSLSCLLLMQSASDHFLP